MDNINKIINLTIEYIDQISSDGRVTGGLIKFSPKKMDNENTITMDIYVFQTNFIRHFNTHISKSDVFVNKLKESIKNNYYKEENFQINFKESKIEIKRNRPEAKTCIITITYEK